MGPDPNRPDEIVQNKFSGGDDVVWTHGAHSLKIGAIVTQNSNPEPPDRLLQRWQLYFLRLSHPGNFPRKLRWRTLAPGITVPRLRGAPRR